MNNRMISAAIVSALALMPALASAAVVEPAHFARGTVAAIDRNALTLTLGGVTYQAENIWELDKVTPGMSVTVTYLDENGKPEILSVDWASKNI